MPRNLIPSTKAIDKAAHAASNGASKRLTDGDGLYLLLFADGGSHGWRFDFTFEAKRKTISFGTYPDTGLALARRKADEARKLVAEGINPSDVRKAKRDTQKAHAEAVKRAQNGEAPFGSFEHAARELHAVRFPVDARKRKWGESYATKWLGALQRHVFPWIGHTLMRELKRPDIIAVLRRMEQRGINAMAQDTREYIGQVCQWGQLHDYCEHDPSANLHLVVEAHRATSYAAVTDPSKLGDLLLDIDGYNSMITRAALQLQVMLFQRPGNTRSMAWAELDLAAEVPTWTIPAVKMKGNLIAKGERKNDHVVPLPRQAVLVLQELKPLTGHRRLVFPGTQSADRPMSNNTMNKALRTLGWGATEGQDDGQTAHGFRATARTVIGNEMNIHPAVVEQQLAHVKSGPLGDAYDRAEFLKKRALMLQTWADFLDSLRTAAAVRRPKASTDEEHAH